MYILVPVIPVGNEVTAPRLRIKLHTTWQGKLYIIGRNLNSRLVRLLCVSALDWVHDDDNDDDMHPNKYIYILCIIYTFASLMIFSSQNHFRRCLPGYTILPLFS